MKQDETMRDIMIRASRACGGRITAVIYVLLSVAGYLLLVTGLCSAGIRDRVIAFVDNQAITMSDLEEQYSSTVKMTPDITKGDVLNTMINRMLLLREAKRYRIEAATQDDIMREYIDLKIKAFIRVSEDDIEKFYQKHITQFAGTDYVDAHEEIERYLTEKELNENLKVVLRELRGKAYIKIFLHGQQGG